MTANWMEARRLQRPPPYSSFLLQAAKLGTEPQHPALGLRNPSEAQWIQPTVGGVRLGRTRCGTANMPATRRIALLPHPANSGQSGYSRLTTALRMRMARLSWKISIACFCAGGESQPSGSHQCEKNSQSCSWMRRKTSPVLPRALSQTAGQDIDGPQRFWI